MTAPSNPYAHRWGWWYPAIADWMIANPGRRLQDCARDLNKSPTTISMIVNTDLFKDFLATRRREWESVHDFALRSKTTKVAELGLDILLESLEKKRSTVPISTLSEITTSALDRLGYSPNKPQASVQINNIQQSGGVTVVPVSVDALREAQEAIRLAQSRRAAQSSLEGSSGSAQEYSAATPLQLEGEIVNDARPQPALSADLDDNPGPSTSVFPRAIGSNN